MEASDTIEGREEFTVFSLESVVRGAGDKLERMFFIIFSCALSAFMGGVSSDAAGESDKEPAGGMSSETAGELDEERA